MSSTHPQTLAPAVPRPTSHSTIPLWGHHQKLYILQSENQSTPARHQGPLISCFCDSQDQALLYVPHSLPH